MAQRVIQLLRSGSVYASKEAAITAVKAMTGTDGEVRIARYFGPEYTENDVAKKDVKDLLCVYHTTSDSTTGKANDPGWTFIEDASDVSDILSDLDANINTTMPVTKPAKGTAPTATDNNKVVTAILEFDGQVYGTATNVTSILLDGYAVGSDAKIADTDSLGGALGKLQGQINAMDLTEVGGSGKIVTTISEADGKVSATAVNTAAAVMTGYTPTTGGSIAATDTIGEAFNKVEESILKNKVSSDDKTVVVTSDTNGGTDLAVNIDGTTIVKNSSTGVISSDLKILKETTGLDTNVREQYKLVYGSSTTAIGDVIKIYKDSALVDFFLGHVDDSLTNADQQGESPDTAVTDGTGATALVYIMQLANGKYKLAAVDVSNFLEESEFSDGLQVSNHVVSVKVDSTSEEVITAYGAQNTTAPVLSVGANGVKVSNIQTAIDAKVGTLDHSDTAVTGEYVSQVTETDGVIAVTRTAVSGATLNSYSKGSDATAVAATDTINQAISKLENQIDAAESGSKTEINTTVGGESATHMTIAKAEDATDGHYTYSFSLADVASEDALETEVTRAQTAEGELATKIGLSGAEGSRTWTPTTNYGGSSATVAANMEALDTAIDGLAGTVAGLNYTDAAVAGQVVTGVDETAGVIAPTRANLSGITLAGFTTDASATGAIADTDTVAGALNKLQNKADASLNSVSNTDHSITVGTKTNKDQEISLNLDTTTGTNGGLNGYSSSQGTGGSGSNVLKVTENGLYLSEVWDCGTFA